MCKCRVQRLREIPIHFALRERGQSKLSLKQQLKYLEHLSRLYDFTFPRASPIVKFLIVTASSWFVAFAAYLWLLSAGVGPAAPVLAFPAGVFATAIFHLRYVRTQRPFLTHPTPWQDFIAISAAEWATCALAAFWISHRLTKPSIIEYFILSFGAATIMRYLLRKEFLQDVRGLRRDFRAEEANAA
jgi:dolichol-phosphate mannosyltransferase